MTFLNPKRLCETEEDKKKFDRSVGAAQYVLKDLLEQAERKHKTLCESGSTDQYALANWPALQAHKNGKKQLCEELIQVLKSLTKTGEDK